MAAVAGLACLIASAAAAQPASPGCSARDLALQYMGRIAARDMDGALAMLDDRLKFQDAWGRVVDKAALTAWYASVFPRLGAPQPSPRPRADGKRPGVAATICEGNRAAIEFVGSSVLNDGSAYQNVYIYTVAVEGGKIVEMHEYTDTDAAKQLYPDVKARAIIGAKSIH